ncbi:uncharacterized protein P884DRAFT_315271 [Thermothelomyces heterothallicus CBS 202.75]|uniref:uncharacterized protein n=1 Tax=Thermothelomyces heterothallicus CBS 202.75 TaxID=1149848 RepID=UPI0037440555
MLASRYERTGEMTDLEEAIGIARQAVDATPHDHPDRAALLRNLGNKLVRRCRRTSKMADLEEASLCFYNAWRCQTAIPFNRIQAAAGCLPLFAAQAKTGTAIDLGQDFIDLLPAVNTKLLDRSDQQFVMSTFASVSSGVCAIPLASNGPADALDTSRKAALSSSASL